ncbi:MAG: dephospho-CoA kinase [Desulfurococcales archaeon ex4484_42]|nr:MAG: dephospho-CoA kinase [Desulfurococcales archaeon ex4484_42]
MPGSGKSVVSRIISSILNAKVISMGDVVREEAARRGMPQDIKSMTKFAEELRRKYGKDIVARMTLKYIEDRGLSGIIVIDGVRSLDEVKVFNSYGNVIIVAVHASPRTRYERLRNRGRRDDPKDWNEFLIRDNKELSFGIGNVIALADIMIINESKSLEDLRNEVESKIKEVLSNVNN